MPAKLLFSPKYKDFLRCQAPVEFLEGTTMAGKTTVGIFKFMLKVAQSPKRLHIIAANDTGHFHVGSSLQCLEGILSNVAVTYDGGSDFLHNYMSFVGLCILSGSKSNAFYLKT